PTPAVSALPVLRAPGCKEASLALGSEADAFSSLRALKCVPNGVFEWAAGEPSGQSARDVLVHEVLPLGISDPQRKFHPLTHFVRDQKLVIDPDDFRRAPGDSATRNDHVIEWKVRPYHVVDAADAPLRASD